MSKFFSVPLFLALSSFSGFGQDKTITINGRIDTTILSIFGTNELALRTLETTNHKSEGKVNYFKIDSKGLFKCKIKSDDAIYLSFELLNQKSAYPEGVHLNVSTPKNRALREAYFYEPGDSVNVEINRNGVLKFHGIGSEKLNCQWEIYNIESKPSAVAVRISDLLNKSKSKEGYLLQYQTQDSSFQLRKAILDSYKGDISDKIYQLLYLDAVAYNDYETFQFLWSEFLLPDRDKLAVLNFYESLIKNDRAIGFEGNAMIKSAHYADFLFQKEFSYSQLHSEKAQYQTGDSFKALYERLYSKYNGRLRDKLIFICYQRLSSKFSKEAKSLAANILVKMEDIHYRTLLKEFCDKKFSAFPFELSDADGRTHRLADYKGKVLIIDFWYTGCTYCAELNTAMTPIVKMFSKNNGIAFLTVSVDKDKPKWKNSVASGRYTSKETINLYTNGLGMNHPLIKNYNFTGYPAQLIIGRDGNLITIAPPRVDVGEEMKQQFLAIITMALKK